MELQEPVKCHAKSDQRTPPFTDKTKAESYDSTLDEKQGHENIAHEVCFSSSIQQLSTKQHNQYERQT